MPLGVEQKVCCGHSQPGAIATSETADNAYIVLVQYWHISLSVQHSFRADQAELVTPEEYCTPIMLVSSSSLGDSFKPLFCKIG